MAASSLSAILDALAAVRRTFITSVPDKGLAELIYAFDGDPRFIHVPCTREEEAVGLCAGAAFAGGRGVVLMQNSGLGNAINALTSLISFYDLPLQLLISMRGEQGERIAAQRPMGRATRRILEACEIRIVEPARTDALVEALAYEPEGRVAIVAPPDRWAALSAAR